MKGETYIVVSYSDVLVIQSIHVCQFDLKGNLLKRFGSVSEASRELGITKTAILNQCNHNVKTKPRCGFWFRYMSEYDKEGFVL